MLVVAYSHDQSVTRTKREANRSSVSVSVSVSIAIASCTVFSFFHRNPPLSLALPYRMRGKLVLLGQVL